MKYYWNLAKSLRSTCEGTRFDQSHRDSASNFTKNETPSQVFLKDPAHFPETPIIVRGQVLSSPK